MFQIVFNEISAAEMAALPTALQLDLLADFEVLPEDDAKAVSDAPEALVLGEDDKETDTDALAVTDCDRTALGEPERVVSALPETLDV